MTSTVPIGTLRVIVSPLFGVIMYFVRPTTLDTPHWQRYDRNGNYDRDRNLGKRPDTKGRRRR